MKIILFFILISFLVFCFADEEDINSNLTRIDLLEIRTYEDTIIQNIYLDIYLEWRSLRIINDSISDISYTKPEIIFRNKIKGFKKLVYTEDDYNYNSSGRTVVFLYPDSLEVSPEYVIFEGVSNEFVPTDLFSDVDELFYFLIGSIDDIRAIPLSLGYLIEDNYILHSYEVWEIYFVEKEQEDDKILLFSNSI